jgi:hypothetical protein
MNWEEPAMHSHSGPQEYLPVRNQAMGTWQKFPKGVVRNGKGGSVTLKLSDDLIQARWVRVVMTQSNNQPGPHGADDVRHRSGYAIYEVYVGEVEADGHFTDFTKHVPDGRKQTATYCSSTDPWHTADSLNPRGNQTGIDLFYTSGITKGLPAMFTVPLIYSIPDDAAAQIEYMKKRGYQVSWMEMDGEADAQYYMPEDYAALYCQFAKAIHKVDPTMKLGGPLFQGINQDVSVWPDAKGNKSWSGRFYDYLEAHGHGNDLTFVSFENYPYEASTMEWDDLYRNQEITRRMLQDFRKDGLPKSIPLMNTESNLSGSLSVYMSDIFSALWLADNIGSFFEEGGGLYIHSPIEPSRLGHGRQRYAVWGNGIFDENFTIKEYAAFYHSMRMINCQGSAVGGNGFCDKNYKTKEYTAFYHSGRMINNEWVSHRTGVHKQYRVTGGPEDAAGNAHVTSYAVKRPDGDWALLIINKDKDTPRSIRVVFEDGGKTGFFSGSVRMVTYGSEQHVWHRRDRNAHADPNLRPVESFVTGSKDLVVTLPKASVTVLRGKVVGLSA